MSTKKPCLNTVKYLYKFEGIVPCFMEYGVNVFTSVQACVYVCVCQTYDATQGQIERLNTLGSNKYFSIRLLVFNYYFKSLCSSCEAVM